jgi:beta-lactamase superfamily II metal-dependent hydrolase
MNSTEALSPPAPDEIEVSIFGPGFGEAIAIHVGQASWILVDSCIDPESRLPVSIRYLNSLGLNPADVVKLVVVTHWHDDHIRGLSKVIEQCSTAKIAMSMAMNTPVFQKFLAAVKASPARETTGFNEIDRVFQQMLARQSEGLANPYPMWTTSRQTLFTSSPTHGGVTVCALSPSDKSIQIAMGQFASLLPPGHDLNKRSSPINPNHNSIVLWLEAQERNILLGADLEHTSDKACGWAAVVDNKVPKGKADAFKVSHHGGKSGHDDIIWTDLLNNDPIAVITPWSKGDEFLPKPDDLIRIKASTTRAYCTAVPYFHKIKFKDHVVRRWVSEVTRRIQPAQPKPGHVRIRLSPAENPSAWKVETFNGAQPVAVLLSHLSE